SGPGRELGEVLLSTAEFSEPIAAAGITPDQVRQALEPAAYLGAAGVFVTAALHAHDERESRRDQDLR
ncbi:MAG: hypothetical protein ACRDND_34380, partial [Streptosporangiaceae bacterium]